MKGLITLELSTSYSLGVLWNLDAANLNASVAAGDVLPAPVDGDAMLRKAAEIHELMSTHVTLLEPTC